MSAETSPLNLMFVSAEVAPWSKTGGLGDVVGGLPIELAKRGHRVLTVAPRYDQYKDVRPFFRKWLHGHHDILCVLFKTSAPVLQAWDTSVTVNIDEEDVRFFHTRERRVDRVWVDHPWFLAKVSSP
jgi:granule-bound starch synthase